MMKLELVLAKFFSTVFHPLIIPSLGMVILFNINTYIGFAVADQAKWFILTIVFINTAIAPILSIYLLKRAGLVTDLMLDERNERLLPMLLSALLFVLTYYLLKQLRLPSLIYYYLIGAAVLVLISLIITFRWKISLHMTSMGALTGFLIVTALLLNAGITWLIMLSVLVSGFVGSSRIRLDAHTPAQVYCGYLLGVLVMIILYTYLKA